jgi:hypothetical protein
MYGLEPDGQPLFVLPDRVQTPHWKLQVERALAERDPTKLTSRVHAAEWALVQRWQELGAGGGSEERIAMTAAVNDLLAIKIHKLQWPDFRANF